MKKLSLLAVSLAFITITANAQNQSWNTRRNFTIMSYNVENLFDTIDNPQKFDEEFTPAGKKNWNTQRYYKKLNNLARVIKSVNNQELPEIIGIVEAENKQVLEDLAKTNDLRTAHYQVILEESPDFRGIDCGLLYNPDQFKYLSHQTFKVVFPDNPKKTTRDVLYVKGKVKKDIVHIFVNHWSSRRGGEEKSKPNRVACAKTLKKVIDSVKAVNPDAKIIALGDFNDEPTNKSIRQVLNATNNSANELVNIMYNYPNKNQGSYYYRGNYSMIDNFIVSSSLITAKKGFRLKNGEGFILHPEFLCYKNKSGDMTPNRTYGGKNYYGGYSDHFAIYATFIVK